MIIRWIVFEERRLWNNFFMSTLKYDCHFDEHSEEKSPKVTVQEISQSFLSFEMTNT